MNSRTLLGLVLAFLLSLALSACGGGGSSGTGASSSTAASDSSTSSSSEPSPKPKGGSVTFGKAHPRETVATQAERRKAGRAAPFVAPKSDNSVPTFGSEADASERDQAEAALKSYLQARAGEDWASACRQLAKSVREGYEKLGASSAKAKAPSCAQVLAALSKGTDLSDPLIGPLLSLRVKGANAFALFYGPGHQQYMVPMNREGGEWRPTQVAPIAYPPGAPSTTSP
jgi:hypothetical protein